MPSTVRAKGTKVMRETSLVMTMLKKKGRATSASTIRRVVAVRRSKAAPRVSNRPSICRPLVTAIRLKSKARVSQSI